MSTVIDTLAVAFTADMEPLAARLSEIGEGLKGVGTLSRQADASLQSMAGALDFSMEALKTGAYAAGASVGTRFAAGLRSKKGAVDSAVKYLTASALAALLKLLGGGTGSSAAASTAEAVSTVSASRFDAETLAGGSAAEATVTDVTIPINVDGIKLGEACVKGLSRVSRLTGRGMIEI